MEDIVGDTSYFISFDGNVAKQMHDAIISSITTMATTGVGWSRG
jgi:hypothetical protein